MTFDGTHIHIADSNDNNFRMILPPSRRMVKPSIVRTYTVSGLDTPDKVWLLMGHISTLRIVLTTMFEDDSAAIGGWSSRLSSAPIPSAD